MLTFARKYPELKLPYTVRSMSHLSSPSHPRLVASRGYTLESIVGGKSLSSPSPSKILCRPRLLGFGSDTICLRRKTLNGGREVGCRV